jgi:hypothetical protein
MSRRGSLAVFVAASQYDSGHGFINGGWYRAPAIVTVPQLHKGWLQSP